MKIVSMKQVVLAFTFALGSVMTLPAYAWPDTDEMNMCGAAVKAVRTHTGNQHSWKAHDKYIAQRGMAYYHRTNCPESKATKNYKTTGLKANTKMATKPKAIKAHQKKLMKKVHMQPNNSADCIAVDRMNTSGHVVRRVNNSSHGSHDNFYRNAQAVLNMGKSQKHESITKRTSGDICVVTNGLNTSGAIVRVVKKKQH